MFALIAYGKNLTGGRHRSLYPNVNSTLVALTCLWDLVDSYEIAHVIQLDNGGVFYSTLTKGVQNG